LDLAAAKLDQPKRNLRPLMRAVVTILGDIAILAFADLVKETHQKAAI
jgi:hypothetical protein